MAPSFVTKALRKIELPQEEEASRWINEDIRPVPPARQTWGPIQYGELWFCVNLNMTSYQVGSSLIASGLNFWQSIIIILVGNAMATGFAVLNSVAGASSHLGFPVICRSVWGMYGAYFPILNRILTSVVWYGVQAVIGGRMIYICLRSIWIDLDDRIPNTLPASIGITTAQFVGYVLFNFLCCVFIWFRPQQLRPYFHFASILVFLTLFVLLGWAVATSEAWGDVVKDTSHVESSSELGWTTVAGMMSIIGNIASGILNQSDYTRFAKKPSHVTWSQAISFMISGCTVACIGVVVTAATQKEYGNGTPLWDPSTLFAQIQDRHGSGGRAAAFFLGVVFIFSQLSINVVGNVLASGLDIASVFPKYVNLRRGAYVVAALSVLPNPWQQLASSSTFLAVLSAYAIFLGPMVGLLCVHFWLIQKRKFSYPDLYNGTPSSAYWYQFGVNWQTVLAWVLAVVPSMPGFVATVNSNVKLGKGASHVFSISFILGFTLAAFFAYVFHLIWPVVPVINDPERENPESVWTSDRSELHENEDKTPANETTRPRSDDGV